MAASKVNALDKNMFSVAIKVTNIASIYVILICSHPEGFRKKYVFENFTKITENICAGVFFQ